MQGDYYVLESGISIPRDLVPIGTRIVGAFLSPHAIQIPRSYIVPKDTEMQHIGICKTVDPVTLGFTARETVGSLIVNLKALDKLTGMLNEEE